MNYYQKIEQYFETSNINHKFIAQWQSLLWVCREYYWVNSIYRQLGSAINILKDYVDPELHLNPSKKKSNTNRKRQELEDVLYVDFFNQIYSDFKKNNNNNKNKSKCKFQSLIKYPNKIEKFIIQETQNISTTRIKDISNAVYWYYENKVAFKNWDNINTAMEQVEKAMALPKPSIEESVNAIISDETMESLYNILTRGSLNNYMLFYFKVAWIRKRLSYEDCRNCEFYKPICTYNYEKLHDYIFSNISQNSKYQGLAGLLEDYQNLENELDRYRKSN